MTHSIIKSSTYLKKGVFLSSTEADNDSDYLSFDTPVNNENGVKINDNIEEGKVTSADDYEFNKYVNVSVNSDSDSIEMSLAGRVLRTWKRSKSPTEINFFIEGWALSIHPEIMNDANRIKNGKYRNKIETLVQKPYADREYDDVSKRINIFWNE